MLPTITTVPLLQLASGDQLSLQVYRFIGAIPGRKAYLQANLHGAEIAGNGVIYELIQWLTQLDATQLTGEIWLVPVCNPIGTNHRSHFFSAGRFNAYDGKDWNRIFWDYEKDNVDLFSFAKSHLESDQAVIQTQFRQQIQAAFSEAFADRHSPSGLTSDQWICYHLQSLALDADYVLDLHTSAGRGIDYLFYFRDREASAKQFGLPLGLLLNEYDGDAFDEAFIKPWLALEQRFSELGRSIQFDIEAWTLELGSAMQLNPSSLATGVRGIKNYLLYKGLITCSEPQLIEAEMQLAPRTAVKKYYAAAGGFVQATVSLGDRISAGQSLYKLLSFNKAGEPPALAETKAIRSGLVYDLAINSSVNQGEYVVGIVEFDR